MSKSAWVWRQWALGAALAVCVGACAVQAPSGKAGACANGAEKLPPDRALLGSFESGQEGPWVHDNDGTATANVTIEAPGANGTGHAVHWTGGRFSSWGASFLVILTCADVSAYSGIDFWGKSANNSVVYLRLPNVLTLPDDKGGTCAPGRHCPPHPAAPLSLHSDWAHYAVPFDALSGEFPRDRIIMSVNFEAMGNVDVSLDEVHLYSGAPPADARSL